MIKMTAGVYGSWDGKKITRITSKDGPFELAADKEARLVNRGVAVYVANEATQKDEAMQKPEGSALPPFTSEGAKHPDANVLPTYHKDMKLIELQEIAKAYGVDASKMRSKVDVVAAIDLAKSNGPAGTPESPGTPSAAGEDDPDGDGDPGADDEPPPAFGAVDPV